MMWRRYQGNSQRRNIEKGDRGRKRQGNFSWGGPRRLQERWHWGKVSGKRRPGEPIKGRTQSDSRRISVSTYEKKETQKRRRRRERRREEVRIEEDSRDSREARKLYATSSYRNTNTKEKAATQFSETKDYERKRTKVMRAGRQGEWGRGEFQRRDERGIRKMGDRSLRTEVEEAGRMSVEHLKM